MIRMDDIICVARSRHSRVSRKFRFINRCRHAILLAEESGRDGPRNVWLVEATLCPKCDDSMRKQSSVSLSAQHSTEEAD